MLCFVVLVPLQAQARCLQSNEKGEDGRDEIIESKERIGRPAGKLNDEEKVMRTLI